MEGDSVNEMFENKYGMGFEEAMILVKSFFKEELPLFAMTNEYLEKTGYWGVEYLHEGMRVFVGCQRGYLEYEINGSKSILQEYKPLMKNVHVASEKNIRFTLNVIKRYMEGIDLATNRNS